MKLSIRPWDGEEGGRRLSRLKCHYRGTNHVKDGVVLSSAQCPMTGTPGSLEKWAEHLLPSVCSGVYVSMKRNKIIPMLKTIRLYLLM